MFLSVFHVRNPESGISMDVVTYVSVGLAKRDPQVIGILVAVLLVLLTTLFLIIRSRSRAKRQAILILGICDAGKTLLFARLLYNAFKRTFTSIKVNTGSLTVPGKTKTVQLIDVPGYDKLRHQAMEENKNSAKAIVFVIDSVSAQKEVKEVAEYLYTVLTDSVISQNSVPILVACNKQDRALARGAKLIRSQLEREITTLRMTRSAALEATDGSSQKTSAFLGVQGKNFEFSDLRRNKVQFAECSATGKNEEANLSEVNEWLSRVA